MEQHEGVATLGTKVLKVLAFLVSLTVRHPAIGAVGVSGDHRLAL